MYLSLGSCRWGIWLFHCTSRMKSIIAGGARHFRASKTTIAKIEWASSNLLSWSKQWFWTGQFSHLNYFHENLSPQCEHMGWLSLTHLSATAQVFPSTAEQPLPRPSVMIQWKLPFQHGAEQPQNPTWPMGFQCIPLGGTYDVSIPGPKHPWGNFSSQNFHPTTAWHLHS